MEWFIANINWITCVAVVVTAISAIGTAIATSFVAVASWRAMRNFTIYRRRERVYLATMNLLASAFRNADIQDEDLRHFSIGTKGATFLFGKDVTSYLDEVRSNAIKIMVSNKRAKRDSLLGKYDESLGKENDLAQKWICNQITNADEVFRKYLDMSHA